MGFYEFYYQEVLENESLQNEIKRLKQINSFLMNQLNYLRNNTGKNKSNEAVDKVTCLFADKVVSFEKQVSSLKSIIMIHPIQVYLLFRHQSIKERRYPIQERKATGYRHEIGSIYLI